MAVTASVKCPRSAKVKQNVALSGAHTWAVENKTAKDVKVKLELILEDSDKNRYVEGKEYVIKAKDTLKGKATSALAAAYLKPLDVEVKATTRVTGAISESKQNTCTFKVE